MTEKGKKGIRAFEWTAKGLFPLAALLLAGSVFLPFWHAHFYAPQYPKGLQLFIYLNHIEGDIREIDGLNHYIGMRPLGEGAVFERYLSLPGVGFCILLLVTAVFVSNRRSFFLLIPVLLFPLVFAGDLYYWLREFGLNLDPRAPLSSSIKPFVPPLFGEGKIAQFRVMTEFMGGFWLSAGAALTAVLAWGIRFLGLCTKAGKNLAVFIFLAGTIASGSLPAALAGTLTAGPGGEYATIASALESAREGDKVLIQPGVYREKLIITKSLVLEGHGSVILEGGGKGTVVTVKAGDVTLRQLTIRQSGSSLTAEDAGVLGLAPRLTVEDNHFEDVLFGVYLRQAPSSVVRNNKFKSKSLNLPRRGDLIRLWYSDSVLIEGNITQDGRDVVLWFSKDLKVSGNIFRRGRYGLHFMYCDGAEVLNNRFEENSVGAYLMYSYNIRLKGNRVSGNRGPTGFGIGFKDTYGAEINHNGIYDNRVGFFFDNTSGDYQGNLLAFNDIGIQLLPSADKNIFHQNSFIHNGTQVEIAKAGVASHNLWENNFWSDYQGYDADGDGIGDTAYEPVQVFEQITDRYPELKLLWGSAVPAAIDLSARIFPIFRPQPKFKDQRPLMEARLPYKISGPRAKYPSLLWGTASLALLAPCLVMIFKHPSYIGLLNQPERGGRR